MKTKEKEEDVRHICGTCKHYDSDNNYCLAHGEPEIYEEDTCDYWEEED